MILFFLDSISAEGFWGIIVAITSSIFFAAMAISVRYNKEGGPPFGIMIYGNLMVFLGGLWFWQAPWPGFGDFMIIAALGLFQFGLPYYLFTKASQGVTSLELVLIPTLEPILNPVWVFLFMGEQPGNWAIIGGIVVICSITVWSLIKTRRGAQI
jgi:drug/metabolite transporter (DMT)-like permease